MRKAEVYINNILAGYLNEEEYRKKYSFKYLSAYSGDPVSLSIPVSTDTYYFDSFPPFFDGLLPEGPQLEALLRYGKLDRSDLFGQLIFVGADLVGAVTLKEITDDV